jgi:UDP:flavonoid glycosyltransferase YjiC (YdhE family)
MPRVVFTTWGSLGDLHPYLALGVELKRRGHAVRVATLAAWRDNVKRAGLEFAPIRPDVPEGDDQARELIRRVLDPRRGPEYLFKEVFAPHMRETFDDTRAAADGADLLVSHQLPVTAPIVAEMTRIRWVSCMLLPMAFLSAYDPPTPPQAPFLRRIAALHPSIARALLALARLEMERWMTSTYRLRDELGLPRGKNPLLGAQHSPERVLGLFSSAFARKQRDYPPQTIVTGFPFYDAADAMAPDPELMRFLDAGEPPIVFTLGSSAVWIAEDFYHTAIAVVRKLGRRALLLAGEAAPALRDQVPASIGVFEYAPHSLVMPRALVNVHQGGVGTTGQALRAGRPMLVVPYGQDQPDNARRAFELGLARTVPRGRFTAARLERELVPLLADSTYAARAAAVGAQVSAERGTDVACDAIDQLLDTSRSH